MTTPQYIYKTFFVEEQNSDMSVMALGKVWHLHKIYLCQSPYFASMFNGSWRERELNFITIEIIDPKITLECKSISRCRFSADFSTLSLFSWINPYSLTCLQPWISYSVHCIWMKWRWIQKRLWVYWLQQPYFNWMDSSKNAAKSWTPPSMQRYHQSHRRKLVSLF